MSMFRKAVLTTAIVGAGLASTTGAAFAGDCPDSGSSGHHHTKSHAKHDGDTSSCLNAVEADNSSGAGEVLGGVVLGGAQTIIPSNVCHNLNGNSILSDNNVALPGGTVHNGDTTETSSSASTAQGTNAASSAPAASATPAGTTSTPIQR